MFLIYMPEITDETVPEVPGPITKEVRLIFWAVITLIVIAMLISAWIF